MPAPETKTTRVLSLKSTLLLPILAGGVALVLTFLGIFYSWQKDRSEEIRQADRTAVERFLTFNEAREADLMTAVLRVISENEALKGPFLARDRERLLAAVEPVFAELQSRRRVTHLYFVGPDRVTFLRAHHPQLWGDTVSRHTALEAERTGQTSTGLDLGYYRGLLTLRVVSPWYDDGRLIGYLELGQEIEHFSDLIRDVLGVEAFVAVRKEFLERTYWEGGMAFLGRQGAWDQLGTSVLSSQTLAGTPEALVEFFSEEREGADFWEIDAVLDGRTFAGGAVPIIDVRGRELGHLVYLRDFTVLVAKARRTLALATVIALLVGTGAFLLQERALSRFLVGPLRRMRTATLRARKGELDAVPVGRLDELGDLGESVNRLLRTLRTTQGDSNQEVMDAAMDAVVVMDGRGSIQRWNTTATRILGWEADEVIGRCFNETVLSSADRSIGERLLENLETTGRTELGNRFEVTACRKDGSAFPAELSMTRVESAPPTVSAFLRDLTETKQRDERLAEAEKMDVVGNLTGGIAREFSGILMTVHSYARIIRQALPRGHPLIDEAGEIEESADRAANLTEQLLSFARRQANDPRVVDLGVELDRVEDDLQARVGPDVLLTMSVEDSVWPVRVDPRQFEQVLRVLVENSLDAMAEGGQLGITATNVPDREPADPSLPSGDYVCITVSDSGHGMDEETLKGIFMPFSLPRPGHRGGGLGLPACYGIIRQAGGVMRIESHPGTGTEVQLLLPRVERRQARVIETTPVGRQGGETVLVVDDEPQMRAHLKRTLEGHGYRVILAPDGLEAVRREEEHDGDIDFLLTDLVMPRMGGLQCARLLRQKHPDLPVVLISGYAEPTPELDALESESCEFLRKPFTGEELILRVRGLLDRRRAVSRSASAGAEGSQSAD